MELDLSIIERRLNHLARAVRRLERYASVELDQLQSEDGLDWQVLHGLQLCIQAVLDISSHIVTASGGQTPENYRDSLVALSRLGVLPVEFLGQLEGLAGFRNILVHGYLNVDMTIVKRILDEHLDDFREFAQYVQDYITGLQ